MTHFSKKITLFTLILIVQLLNVVLTTTQTHAATTTLTYAGTANDIGGGSFSWSNPSNATGDTTITSATSTISTRNAYTNYLSLTNFNLAGAGLPSNAVINGIQVEVERQVSNNKVKGTTVQLTKNGASPVGNNYGSASNGPTSKTITTYGGLTNLWGTTWSTGDLLSNNFGVILMYQYTNKGSASVNIYRVRIIVDYTEINNPGGVGGTSLWLKADAGTSTISDGTSLNSWNDSSGNGFNAIAGVSPTYLNNDNDNLNFNPVVSFNGSTQYMQNLNNGAYSHSYYTVIVPNNTTNGTVTGQMPFGFDCNSGILSSGTCGLPFSGLTIGAFTIAINDEVITHAIGASTSWRSAQIGAYSYEANKPILIGMNENSTGNGTDIYEKGIKINNYTANDYQTLSNANYRIGMSMDSANPFPYNGKIAEIINFSSRLTDTERQKIESYLSLKYGITLNSGTQNYIASDGTTSIWSVNNAGLYTYNIFGIGRDDDSELSQVKSKSSNSDSVITIEALGEGTNMNPSFIDIDNLEFLTISNNNLGNTWLAVGAPAGYYNLERNWRVQETGEVGTLNLIFDVGNTNFDIPDLNIGTQYYFVYDSNNNGILSDETPISMTNVGGNIWEVGSINLNNNQIFTIATQASTNNIPTDISLSNNTINENVEPGITIGIFSTSDADSGDTHTYTLISGAGDTDNSYFSINTNILSINDSPDYELKNTYSIRVQTDDSNGGQFQKQFTVYINNIAEDPDTIIDFESVSDESKYNVTSGNWTRTTSIHYEGLYSIESNNGGLPNTQSCFEINSTFSTTGTISFYYNVSSQANGDYLRFYIDNIEQQAWSGTVPWTNYIKNNISAGTHSYKWCYIKDTSTNSGSDKAWIDYITLNSVNIDLAPPTITSVNYTNGSLLPGGNHNIIINYNDSDSGIDTTSDNINLYKWNGSSWGSDISAIGLNLGTKTITTTSATYTTNNLSFGKYRYNFQISDNEGNFSSTEVIFYIDEPELIINTGSLDIGKLKSGNDYFTPTEFQITVKTVGVGFNLVLNKIGPVIYDIFEIVDYNGVNGVGYDKEPYTSSIHKINPNEIIATQGGSINTNGEKNIYIYKIRMGASVGNEQAAGNYIGGMKFTLDLDY
ncbi:MAG: cadherin repeat domain-containing protein [Candidatus Gracilibacteria bacterium]|nr:cadherin repeat domain-containing protein [Candidatus Gracilibacteria bacterium]